MYKAFRFEWTFLLQILLFAVYSVSVCSAIALEWVQINVPTSSSTSSFISVSYSNEFNVVATAQSGTGSTIIRSVDNGLTWTTSTYNGGTIGFIYDIFGKEINGVVYYLAVDDSGTVYLSLTNGTSFTSPAAVPFSGYSVSIGSNGVAFIAGSSYKIYSSSTASTYATWTSKSPSGITPLSNFYDISTYDGVNVITVGAKGLIYYSANAGTSWTKSTSGVPASTQTVYTVDHGSSLVAMVSHFIGSN